MATYKAMWRKYREAISTGNCASYAIAYRLAAIVAQNGDIAGCQNAVNEALFILNNRKENK